MTDLDIRELELRDRKGYEAASDGLADLSGWEAEAIWPEASYRANSARAAHA